MAVPRHYLVMIELNANERKLRMGEIKHNQVFQNNPDYMLRVSGSRGARLFDLVGIEPGFCKAFCFEEYQKMRPSGTRESMLAALRKACGRVKGQKFTVHWDTMNGVAVACRETN
jgi:hypothetical protein